MGKHKRLWSDEDVSKIIKLYTVDKYKMSEIGQMFSSHAITISKILKNNGIKNNYHCPTDNRVFDRRYFQKIDTEEKAYFLGLLFADGCVQDYKAGNPRISIRLKESDKPIIDRFKECIGSNNSVYYCKEKKGSGLFGFSIRSKEMADDLSIYGIIPNKTYKTKSLPIIDDCFIAPFIRGLVDGDGSIYYSNSHWSLSFSNYNIEMCKSFQNSVNMLIGKENNIKPQLSKNKKGQVYIITYQKYDTKKICELLYKNSNVHIARKYKNAMLVLSEDK